MNPAPSVEQITGYAPPSVDLATFRAGTVWHYRNVGYLVTACSFGERVEQRITRTFDGKPIQAEVWPDARVEVRIILDRADWADPLPMARTLDGYDQPGVRLLFDEVRCWVVADFEARILTPFPLVVRNVEYGYEPPNELEVTLWRQPDQDVAP